MAYYDTGERIKNIRKRLGMSQDQLSELASLNRVTIAKYESGRIEPGANALARIADALGVSTDVLLGREEESEIKSVRKPITSESRIISEGVDKMPPEDREKALNILKAVYSDYFDETGEKMA